jgi:hypothetical protein
MTIKYKLAFTIDSETLFGIMAKFLPIQDLSVEEVMEPFELKPVPAGAMAILNAAHKSKPKHKPKPQVHGRAADITRGVNAVIMGVLADRQVHTYGEIRAAIAADTPYSPNGIGSRMARLVELGYVNRLGGGEYRATTKGIPNTQENAT